MFLSFCMLMVSCGDPAKLWPMETKQIKKIEPAVPEDYSYELRTKSCSTGQHSFATFADACNALKDDQLNNNCALEKREELFVNSECQGNFS